MQFDNLPTSPYLNIVFSIIRNGIITNLPKLKAIDNEDLKNQMLTETFNYLGTTNENIWIGVGKENISKGKQAREDIYFHLNDENHTRIFFVEGKRLPKYNTKTKQEYVIGTNSFGNPSGGVERFKKGIHGDPNRISSNGLIAYVENESIEYWAENINCSIRDNFNIDELMVKKDGFINEFLSTHKFECESITADFNLHHFWIELFN
jgi:hypothetical protein